MFCFGRFCLICLNNAENLTNLDVNIVLSDENISLLQILMEIDAKLLNFDEIFPKYICNSCKKDLITSYKFHKRCRKSINNLTNYISKLNNVRLPSNNNNKQNSESTRKTYSFGYNEITSRHMLFKIKKLTKKNYNTKISILKSISARSNLSNVESVQSKSISDKSTIILGKTKNFNLKNTIDKLAKYLNITDLDKLDQNNLDQHNLEQNILEQNVLEHNVLEQNVLEQNILRQNALGQNALGENVLGQNILDQNVLDQNILDQNNLESNSLELRNVDVTTQDSNATSAIINQKFAQIIETAQNLNQSDLMHLDQEFYDVFNVTDDYFVKEENALDLGSCDLSDISTSSKIVDVKSEIKNEQIKSEDQDESTNLDLSPKIKRSEYAISSSSSSSSSGSSSSSSSSESNTCIDLTETSNNNYIDLTGSPKKSNILQDVSNSPITSKNITQSCIDLTESPTKSSNTLDPESKDASEIKTHSQSLESNSDFNLTGSNYSIIDSDEEIFNQSVQSLNLSNFSEDIEFNDLDLPNSALNQSNDLDLPNSALIQSNDNLNSSVELDIKQELIDGHILYQSNLDPNLCLDQSNDESSISIESEMSQELIPNKNSTPTPSNIPKEAINSTLEPSNLDHHTSDLERSNDNLNNSLELEIKPELTDQFSAQDCISSGFHLHDLNLQSGSKNAELDIEEHPIKYDPDEMEDIKIKIEEILKEHVKLESDSSKDNISKRKLDLSESKMDPKRSKITQNGALQKNVNDPEILEPNDPNPETTSKRKDSLNTTSIKCNTTFLSSNLKDLNLESNAPNDPNIRSKIQKKSPKSINTSLSNVQEPNDPNLSQQTIVSQNNVPKSTNSVNLESTKDPHNLRKDPTNLNPTKSNDPNLKSGISKVSNEKVLAIVKSCKKPTNLNQKNPNIQELELLDLEDPNFKILEPKVTILPKLCHKEVAIKLDPHKTVVPNHPHKTILDLKDSISPSSIEKERHTLDLKAPNDPKDTNKSLKPDLHENKHLKDSKRLSPKKSDLNDSKSNYKDPNDPKLQNLEPNDDPQSKKLNPDMQATKLVTDIKYVSPKKINLKETKLNDLKTLNLVPNDPRIKKFNTIVPETKHCNQTKDLTHVVLDLKGSSKNDPNTLNLDPYDPKSHKLTPKDTPSNKSKPDIKDTQQLSTLNEDCLEAPNDPKSGPTDPDAKNNDATVTKASKPDMINTTPDKLTPNDPISNQTPKNVNSNPSTSNENRVFAPHTCRFCTLAYETGFQLKTHIYDDHNDKFNECATCKMTFSKRYKLLKHIELYHTNNIPDLREVNCQNFDYQRFENFESYDNRPPRSFDVRNARPRNGAGPFRNEYFRTAGGFRNDNFRARTSYVCDMCCKTFFSPFNLNKHYHLEHYR